MLRTKEWLESHQNRHLGAHAIASVCAVKVDLLGEDSLIFVKLLQTHAPYSE